MKSKKQLPATSVARALGAALLLTCSTSFAAAPPPLTDQQKTLYAIGVSISRSLRTFHLNPEEFQMVQKGLVDGQTGAAKDFDLPGYSPKIQELAKSRRAAQGAQQAAAGKEYLEKAAQEKGAQKTESGMVYLPLKEGKGEHPKLTDTVKVNYRGTLIDGTEFDSSYRRGKPLEFRLDSVITCWIEGVQKMRPGGKAKLVCPPKLAYGDAGAGELILPGATLVFDVELLEVLPPKAAGSGQAPAAKPSTPTKK